MARCDRPVYAGVQISRGSSQPAVRSFFPPSASAKAAAFWAAESATGRTAHIAIAREHLSSGAVMMVRPVVRLRGQLDEPSSSMRRAVLMVTVQGTVSVDLAVLSFMAMRAPAEDHGSTL